jgi:hypothetical protein
MASPGIGSSVVKGGKGNAVKATGEGNLIQFETTAGETHFIKQS